MKSKQPLYAQIAAVIKARIVEGLYKPGEKIPPIRQLTETFGVNKATVHKAFECLKQEGVLENRVGSGSYVRYPEKIAAAPGLFDFRTDYLHERFFPHQQVQTVFNTLFEQEGAGALAPVPTEGDPELLQVLGQHYHLPAERMLIVSGAQQGLDLVAKVFSADISASMLFEDPTYPGAISLFRARHFVPLEADGPDLAHMDRLLPGQIRLYYAMPSVHNPTGIAYSLEKKSAVARRARDHGFFIIEDDYLGELKPDAPRLVDLAPERTIHIKSFSQTTLAGLRLGFMVVPTDLYKRFVFAKYSSDITSFGLLQKALREFIRQGKYSRHLADLRRLAAERRRRLLDLLQSFPALHAANDRWGYSLWVRPATPLQLDAPPWSRGEEFSFSPTLRHCFKLAFMHMDDAAFDQSLPYLQDLLRRGIANGTV
ncbi:PLP-dependent aminotransferase family protein [Desulfatitalea alkaliphila]|uniref:PLP-dependent aminotransferase family protein n=1 Tax=Desulfatitalea alkaliphila TaxID=2929485 RepID=A0AA41R7Y8_9BACT|nr:PLP-dependent aminotransferase family protein [Desulfatitalea alkaliphila]MCJ8500633.1 PLP-dependent aminotransferase family protein [Desulfatitalea alkaliphila]